MTKRKKILHIGQMIGGLDVYIRNSIMYANSDFEYVIVRGDKDKNKPITKNGNIVKEYGICLYRELNPWFDIKAIIWVIKIIRNEHPDIIHCHSAKGGIVGRIAGFLTHTNTFYTPHAFSFLCTPSKLKRNLFLFIERLTRLNSNLLACSSSERELGLDLVHYKSGKAFVWNNAVPDAYNEIK